MADASLLREREYLPLLESVEKTIEIDKLEEPLLETSTCRVNALHRQAVDRLEAPLRVVARDAAGVVQAIEDSEQPYLFGVQWHPEYLPQVERQHRLFRRLVSVAGQDR